LWTGSLLFGLVQMPIELFPAESPAALDFDLLDRRDLAPIGYRKVNRRTEEEVPAEEIVRAVEIAGGDHVIVGDDELEAAAGDAHRMLEIEQFVESGEVPPAYFERPFHVLPGDGGEKIYGLLVRALAESDRLGLGRFFLRTRESLAAIAPEDDRLLLLQMRWPAELRRPPELPKKATATPGARELATATRLIEEMTAAFRPAAFVDRYETQLLALVKRRQRQGKVARARPAARKLPERPANVVDLVALLERSVDRKRSNRTRKPRTAAASRRAKKAG
jgi:DNA end-binding protein Ku